jgi:hypothetical protein
MQNQANDRFLDALRLDSSGSNDKLASIVTLDSHSTHDSNNRTPNNSGTTFFMNSSRSLTQTLPPFLHHPRPVQNPNWLSPALSFTLNSWPMSSNQMMYAILVCYHFDIALMMFGKSYLFTVLTAHYMNHHKHHNLHRTSIIALLTVYPPGLNNLNLFLHML